MVTFGCQRVALQAEKRGKERRASNIPLSSSDVSVTEEDFKFDVSESHDEELDGKVTQLPLPVVLNGLKEMVEDMAGAQNGQYFSESYKPPSQLFYMYLYE